MRALEASTLSYFQFFFINVLVGTKVSPSITIVSLNERDPLQMLIKETAQISPLGNCIRVNFAFHQIPRSLSGVCDPLFFGRGSWLRFVAVFVVPIRFKLCVTILFGSRCGLYIVALFGVN